MINIDNDDINKKIRKSLRDTARSHSEHGFNMCLDDGSITTTDVEKGKKYGVNIRNSCTGKIIGSFHTHTDTSVTANDAIPSPKDIMKSVSDGIPFFCIGGLKEGSDNKGMMRCFDKKDLEIQVKEAVKHAYNEDAHNENLDKNKLERGSKLLVRRMIKDKNFLDQHSFQRKIDI